MRTRFLVPATLLCAAVVTVPEVALAAPTHNRGLTIAAIPDAIIAGEAVLIYGQLHGPDDADQTITLYHRVNPRATFSVVGTTTTDASGGYELTRAEGVVVSDRSWYVRGPSGSYSRTTMEEVAALVSLAASAPTANTGLPVVFSGHLTPSHPLQLVELQEQDSLNGGGWATIATTFTDALSNFSVPHRWALPGIYTVRAVFPSDPRNREGDSDSVTVTVDQQERPSFTVGASAPIVPSGQPVTISGVLYQLGSTTTEEPSTQVALYGKLAGGIFKALATTYTGPDGSYSFTESPAHNEVFRAQTARGPKRATANLYVGAQDVVTASSSSLTAPVGGSVTLSGTVTPDHTGHLVYLQRLGADGFWHNVVKGTVGTGSTYSLSYSFGQTGSIALRARIYGGPDNVGAPSPPMTVSVNGVEPVSSLPPAS